MPTMMIPGSVDHDRLLEAFKAYPTYSRFASLLARHRIPPKAVVQAVHDEVTFVIEGVRNGCTYTAKDLCGEHLWYQLPTAGLHRAMGICLSFFVQTGHLPLVCTTRDTRQTKRYRRINPETDLGCLASDNHLHLPTASERVSPSSGFTSNVSSTYLNQPKEPVCPT